MRPIWSFKIQIFVRPCLALKNPFLGSYHNCIFVPQLLAICILASHLLGIISQFLLFLLWPHFGQIIKLSLSFITFWVSHFPVSHLTYETVKLGLQNTLNMSKTTRVYFGVLHPNLHNASLLAMKERESNNKQIKIMFTKMIFQKGCE